MVGGLIIIVTVKHELVGLWDAHEWLVNYIPTPNLQFTPLKCLIVCIFVHYEMHDVRCLITGFNFSICWFELHLLCSRLYYGVTN